MAIENRDGLQVGERRLKVQLKKARGAPYLLTHEEQAQHKHKVWLEEMALWLKKTDPDYHRTYPMASRIARQEANRGKQSMDGALEQKPHSSPLCMDAGPTPEGQWPARLVLAAFRQPQLSSNLEKKHMLVLTRGQLEKLYGPSLATRPRFLVDFPARELAKSGGGGKP